MQREVMNFPSHRTVSGIGRPETQAIIPRVHLNCAFLTASIIQYFLCAGITFSTWYALSQQPYEVVPSSSPFCMWDSDAPSLLRELGQCLKPGVSCNKTWLLTKVCSNTHLDFVYFTHSGNLTRCTQIVIVTGVWSMLKNKNKNRQHMRKQRNMELLLFRSN